MTLPAGLSQGWHRIVVRNPSGYAAASGEIVQVGQTLVLPTVLLGAARFAVIGGCAH